jgi:hypothetical protein
MQVEGGGVGGGGLLALWREYGNSATFEKADTSSA